MTNPAVRHVARGVIVLALVIGGVLSVAGRARATAAPAPRWTVDAAPSPVGAWDAVLFVSGRWYLFGPGGALATSTDATTWSERTVPSGSWRAAAHGDGRFVVLASVDHENDELTSTDGRAWTAIPGPSGAWSAVTFADGRFVAVGEKGTVAVSLNGLTWTTTFSKRTEDFTGVAFGNSRFVVVDAAQGDTLVSINGARTWAFYPASVPGLSWGAVAYGNGNFVAFDGAGTGTDATSVLGFAWTLHTYAPAQRFDAATFACNTFVATGQSTGATNEIFTSPTGASETGSPVPTGASADWDGVGSGDGRFVAVDGAGDVTRSAAAHRCGPTIPMAPQQVSGNVASGQVWTYTHPPPSPGGAPVNVYRVTITGGTTTKRCFAPVYFEPNCIIKGLANHHVYEVTTQAHNRYGYSVPSDPEFVIPVAQWTLATRLPARVVLAGHPVTVQLTGVIANSEGIYPLAKVAVTFGARSATCWPSPFGECLVTFTDATPGRVAVRASYTGYGTSYESPTDHVFLASVSALPPSVGVSQVFVVTVRGGEPGSPVTVTLGDHTFRRVLSPTGSGSLVVTAPSSAGRRTLAVSDAGALLETTRVSVHP